jgi:hypothetical protein
MVGSWIYSYLCNQCLSPLTLWVRIPLRWDVLNTTLYNKVCQWLATDRSFSPGTPVSSTNKTDRHEITEILLKVASNIINQNKPEFNFNFHFQTWFYIHMYCIICVCTRLDNTLLHLYRQTNAVLPMVYPTLGKIELILVTCTYLLHRMSRNVQSYRIFYRFIVAI